MNASKIIIAITAILALLVVVAPSSAWSPTYWQHDPATPGDWHDPTNWNYGIPTLPSSGAYINNGGTAQIFADAESYRFHAGYDSFGTIEQFGGTNTVDESLYLGTSLGSSGTYNLSAGELSASSELIGNYGTGEFNQTGGTNTVTGPLWLGRYGSSGTYNLSGTGQLSAGSESIGGCFGTGVFNQTGGTNTVIGLSLSACEGSSGTYNLSAGELSASSELIGGYKGNGYFTQTGGNHTITDYLYLGHHSGSSGTYNLSAGELSVGSDECIGYDDGTGEFNQDGGTHTVTNHLYLGYYTAFSGTYNLSGTGELSASSEYIGYNYGTGVFNQTGGTNTVTDYLYLGRYSGSSGEYNFYGGSLEMGDLDIDNGWMDINISEIDAFTVSGDKVSLLDGYIADGKIFDSSSSDEIYAVYDADNDWTTLGIGVIPEPGTIILIGSALVGLAGVLRRNLR